AGGAKAPPGSPASTDVTIVPDPETNSLVITASPKTMRQLRNVIDKLDIRRAQVLVEAIIVELTSDKSAELGITWATDAINGHGVAGLTNYSGTGAGIAQLAAAAQSDNPAAAAASLPDGLNLAFGRVNKGKFSFAGLLRALAGDANTNILSTPSIVTMDNEEAHIEVGQKVPFVTGQFTNTGAGSNNGSVNPFQTIQRESVGIKLDITPQINEGNSIKLKIQQEASSLSQSAAGAGNPITNERKIETTVMVDNGEIIVLGGLIDTNLSENEQRVPVLGSIPLLGNLFKYRKTTKTKRNLMVFLQPAIIRDRQDTRYYTDSKYNYIRQLEQGRRKEGVQLMPGEQRPVIPSADESRSRVRTPQSSSGNQDQPADGANQDTTKQSEQDTNGGSSR
ncbi:MAG: type II secretion system secretin GspD, partial [Gammaproteobacteria bacterium]